RVGAVGFELLSRHGDLVPALAHELALRPGAGLDPGPHKLGDLASRRLFGLVVVRCGTLRLFARRLPLALARPLVARRRLTGSDRRLGGASDLVLEFLFREPCQLLPAT